jgi:4-amino-4-deoxy-L-arabinose transferase-like glycosyltransferase
MLKAAKKYLYLLLHISIKFHRFDILFYTILISAFAIRVANLNYNSAFNDEAIYIVVGRMGLFTNDWWSYGAKLWMAGLPYIYPALSALAYQTGGLIGSRLLNVIFGTILVEEVYQFTNLIKLYDDKTNKIASLISAFIVGFSAIGIFISKLATYDILSFLLLMLGINSFLKAEHFKSGKYYFLAFIGLYFAFLTKIVIAVFFPLLFVLSLWLIWKRPKKHKNMAVLYLYIPFILATMVYLHSYLGNLITYLTTHQDQGKSGYLTILQIIWDEAKFGLVFLIPAGIMLYRNKRFKQFVVLTALSSVIPLFHLAIKRYLTLDKHMYLSVIFMSVIIGYGISLLILKRIRTKITKLLINTALIFASLLFVIDSNFELNKHQQGWENTKSLGQFISSKVNNGDKILTEDGASVILSLYENIFPPGNIITFDWIDYSGFTDDRGYSRALKDVYFDYIEIDNEFEGKDKLKNMIRQSLAVNYSLIYKTGVFEVYEKNGK